MTLSRKISQVLPPLESVPIVWSFCASMFCSFNLFLSHWDERDHVIQIVWQSSNESFPTIFFPSSCFLFLFLLSQCASFSRPRDFNPVKVIFISGNVFSTMKNMGEGGDRAPPVVPPGRSLMSDDNIRLENCPQNFSWLPKLHFAISRGYSTRTVRTSWRTHNNATERLKKMEMTNCFRLTHQVWNKEFTAELM